MATLKETLINSQRSHLIGHVNKHIANIEVLLVNPVGIGEHQDIQQAIEEELAHIAEYYDKLEMLEKFFVTPMQQQVEDKESDEA